MHGYRILKESNQLDKISDVKESLANSRFSYCSVGAAKLFFGAALNNAEIAIRQYLIIHVAGLSLNKSLLYSIGKPGSAIIHPLPPEWRRIIEQHGFRVSKIRSVFAWQGFVILRMAYGIATIAIQAIVNFKAVLFHSLQPLGRYAYFESLTVDNLPQSGKDGRSYDIVTWYQQWAGRILGLDTLCHSVKGASPRIINNIPVISTPSAILPLTRFIAIIRYVVWGIAASATAIFDLFRGRWWHALLMREAAKSVQVRLQDPYKIAKDYMFHQSGPLYRPLWTYEAEKHGSRITFYFYATNIEGFKPPEGYNNKAYTWQTMNWPHYLVWDEYQADFVRRAVGKNANISVTGPIWFENSEKAMKFLPQNSIAVFDVQPHRDSRYQIYGADQEYYTPSTANQFLLDIYHVLKEFKVTMVLKRKRNIGNMLNRRYSTVVQKLNNSGHLISVEPDISARRVIERCAAVISMPFTSTSLIGRELGKPAIYYDPLGMVQKDDRAAHGIEIISGTQELFEWVNSVIRKEQS